MLVDNHAVGEMNDDRVFLTAGGLAPAAGLDPRDKELKALEPTAYLEQTKGRIDLFSAKLVAVLQKQEGAKRNDQLVHQ
jgi:hypothetical protein